MNEKQIEAARLIDEAKNSSVYSMVSNWTTLKKVTSTEWHGPCPLCGGTDRFHVNTRGNFCGCRKCDRRWDAVGIYAAVHNIQPGQAAREILGISTVNERRKITKIEPAEKVEEVVRGPEWQAQAAEMIEKAKRELFSHEFPGGLEYLRSRGLNDEVLRAFSIGFDHAKFHPMVQKSKPAIIIPWIADEIQAVKYRFPNTSHKERFSQKGGSLPRIFGQQNLTRYDRLVVIEGDLNALSVWQIINDEADVLSVGNDSSHSALDMAVAIAENRGYDSVACWFDTLQKAVKACQAFTHSRAMPMFSRQGLDANDCLVKFGEDALREITREAFDRPDDTCPRCLGKRFEVIGRGLYQGCPDCGGSK